VTVTEDRRDDATSDDEGSGGLDFLPRVKAAEYLSKRLGRPVSAGAMKRWASEGWGPPFAVILRKASYRKADLDRWLASPDALRTPGGARPRKR
jgi:hypothetical protein